MKDNIIKIKRLEYTNQQKIYLIKDIYFQTEPYSDLYSIRFDTVFKNKEDAIKELILYLYFEDYYIPQFNINTIHEYQLNKNDISHLENFLDKHLTQYGFSWEISELYILFNEKERIFNYATN